ncbi:hypothetical protein FACS189449_10790 [Alphaproteobacteria bacterium]|nr:hypothetical protein FACS189449_10790 [Alphaproteobacteria bacterium]
MKYTTLRSWIVIGLLLNALQDVSSSIQIEQHLPLLQGSDDASELLSSPNFGMPASDKAPSSAVCDWDDDRDTSPFILNDGLPKGEWTKQAKEEILKSLRGMNNASDVLNFHTGHEGAIETFFRVYVTRRFEKDREAAKLNYVMASNSVFAPSLQPGIDSSYEDVTYRRAQILADDGGFLDAVDGEIERLRKTKSTA